jgi:uncharacterized membrane protein YjdF
MSEKEKGGKIKNLVKDRLTLIVWLTIGLFVLFEFVLGNGYRPNGIDLMNNIRCFKYLGCNAGFFGYDALVHFTAGIFEAPLLIWIFKRYYHINLFHDGPSDFWKNVFILIAVLAFLAFGWEMIEFIFDSYRAGILHQNLLVPNRLLQASDADTMGDMFFSIIGGVIGAFVTRFFGSDIF